jgi:hypothetical protein
MASEATAEYFKDKSVEEIINWMAANLSTDQMRACLENKLPETDVQVDTLSLPSDEVLDEKLKYLMEACKDKKYLIHKKIEDTVFFWYYEKDKERWTYYRKPFLYFPQDPSNPEGKTFECDEGELVTLDQEIKDIQKAYNNALVTIPNALFNSNNPGVDQTKEFIKTRELYRNQKLNLNWILDILTAIQVQYLPILLESYVVEEGQYKGYNFYVLNIDIDKNYEVTFAIKNLKDMSQLVSYYMKYNEEIKQKLIIDSDEGGSSSAAVGLPIDEWKKRIITATENLIAAEPDDWRRISTIYTQYPLNIETEQKFFMLELQTLSN